MPSTSRITASAVRQAGRVATLLDRCGRNRYRETLAMHRGCSTLSRPTPPACSSSCFQSSQDGSCFGMRWRAATGRDAGRRAAVLDEPTLPARPQDSWPFGRGGDTSDGLSFDDFLADISVPARPRP